jgi:CDP-diacylglycerol--glycerol-3-phosphate 3-phosphatidyltransferase
LKAALNLPNALTLSRLLGIPVLFGLLLARFPYHDQAAALAFAAFSLTDTLDGRLARNREQVTELGKFLDPLADKLFILSILVILVQERLLAAWVVVVIFGRELLITLLRSVGLGQGRVIAASGWGKTKTVTQTAAVFLVILDRPYPALLPLAYLAVAVAVLFTLWSGLDYLWRFRHVITHPTPVLGGAPAGVRELAAELGRRLVETGQSLVVAESCTGGMLGAALTDLAGSSRYFLGGVIAYSDDLKRSELGVPADILREHGAVSRPVAEAMAEGARRRLGADYAVAVTGIAGPGGDGSAKPVGLTYVAVAGPGSATVEEHRWSGDRADNRRRSVEAALKLATAAVDKRTPVR